MAGYLKESSRPQLASGPYFGHPWLKGFVQCQKRLTLLFKVADCCLLSERLRTGKFGKLQTEIDNRQLKLTE